MMNLGDFTTSETIYVPFTTYDSNGASVTITGLAVTDIEIYKDGSVTQRSSDAGYALLDTDGIDFDSTTGLHGFSIDLSDNTDSGFYANGSQYWLVVNAITVDSQTVVFCYYFTIGRYLKPTTAGRTLDVTATGAAGIDWGNVENPTTAVDLSGTDIQLCDTVTTNTDMRGTDNAATAAAMTTAQNDLDIITGAAGVLIDSGTGTGQLSISAGVVNSNMTKIAGSNVSSASGVLNVNVAQISLDSVAADNLEAMLDGTGGVTLTTAITGNITGNLSGSVGSVTGAVGSVTGAVGSISGITFPTNFGDLAITATTGLVDVNGKTGFSLSSAGVNAVADQVWDELTSGHAVSGSTGEALTNATAPTAAAVADAVWDEAQSGHTTAGTFGKYLDAQVSGVSSGSGANVVTITVDDGTSNLENAKVRFTEGVNSYDATTNSSGVATFSLDSATYTVSITKQGYTFTPTTLAISGTTSQTYSMSAVSVSAPSDPALCTAYLTTLDTTSQTATAGVVLNFQIVKGPGTSGYSPTDDLVSGTSDANGLLQVELLKGATYEVRRLPSNRKATVVIPDASTYLLPEILGH